MKHPFFKKHGLTTEVQPEIKKEEKTPEVKSAEKIGPEIFKFREHSTPLPKAIADSDCPPMPPNLSQMQSPTKQSGEKENKIQEFQATPLKEDSLELTQSLMLSDSQLRDYNIVQQQALITTNFGLDPSSVPNPYLDRTNNKQDDDNHSVESLEEKPVAVSSNIVISQGSMQQKEESILVDRGNFLGPHEQLKESTDPVVLQNQILYLQQMLQETQRELYQTRQELEFEREKSFRLESTLKSVDTNVKSSKK